MKLTREYLKKMIAESISEELDETEEVNEGMAGALDVAAGAAMLVGGLMAFRVVVDLGRIGWDQLRQKLDAVADKFEKGKAREAVKAAVQVIENNKDDEVIRAALKTANISALQKRLKELSGGPVSGATAQLAHNKVTGTTGTKQGVYKPRK